MDKKTLELAFGTPLTAEGFKKKGASWFRLGGDVMQVVNLQKSSWGMLFYVNLCFVPIGMDIEGMPTPKQHKCPIRIRLDTVYPQQKQKIEMVFNLELSAISEFDRPEQITLFSNDLVLPFMASLKDLPSLKLAIEKGKFENAAVNLAAKRYLGIQLPE